MAAKFYTDAEIKTACDKAVEIAAEGVESFNSDVGVHYGRALFLFAWKHRPAAQRRLTDIAISIRDGHIWRPKTKIGEFDQI